MVGAVMSKEMDTLVDGTLFKPGQKPELDVLEIPKIYEADCITQIPYICKQTISILHGLRNAQ